jgi:hypothetical protein
MYHNLREFNNDNVIGLLIGRPMIGEPDTTLIVNAINVS